LFVVVFVHLNGTYVGVIKENGESKQALWVYAKQIVCTERNVCRTIKHARL